MALVSRWLWRTYSWSTIALISPIALFASSSLFFAAMHVPEDFLKPIAASFSVTSLYVIMSLGSLYYILGTTAKYTIFDMCKEIAFLSIEKEERMRAKSVIDCVGSRLGKSGASCLYQFLLVIFGSTAGQISIIGTVCIAMIGSVIFAVHRLGEHASPSEETQEPAAA